MRDYGFSGDGADWWVLVVEVVDSWGSFTEELSCSVTKKLVDSSGDVSDCVRALLKTLQLRGEDPITRQLGVVVGTETIRQHNVFEAAGFSNIFVLR